jgi:hypothetical protein
VIAHAKVRAGSSAQARFVENSTMHAGTLVVILGMALHSELQALNQVLVGTESGTRGRLVGGTTRATMLVRAPWLGAAAGGLTRIHVGINPAFEARCNELDRTIEHEQVEADKLQQVVKHLKAHGDPRGMLERVQSAWKQALRDWSASLAEKAELDRQLALTREARVEAGVGIGGDVDIAFGKVVRHLRGGRDGGAFCVDELGRVVYITPDGTPCEIL